MNNIKIYSNNKNIITESTIKSIIMEADDNKVDESNNDNMTTVPLTYTAPITPIKSTTTTIDLLLSLMKQVLLQPTATAPIPYNFFLYQHNTSNSNIYFTTTTTTNNNNNSTYYNK